MAALFQFDHAVAFSTESAQEILRSLPNLPGVFALCPPDAPNGKQAEPYLTRTADVRRRVRRLLDPPESQSKRLNLRDKVARIEYCVTGSDFESTLVLYDAAHSIYGAAEARRRLKLHTPYFLRFTAENRFPRVYATNRLSKRNLAQMYGPFPSRAAAERYCDAILDLFKLRRCYEDLEPYPEHPGCVYQEMKKCLAPCNQAHTPEGAASYSAEAAAVKLFFDTGGDSMLAAIGEEREHASADMEFEKAASLHAQWQKVKAAASLADELVLPIPALRAVIVQKAARIEAESETAANKAAIFLLNGGCLIGPERLSTLGVRAVKEQTSVGSSLFAQPLMLQAVPLPEANNSIPPPAPDNPEDRAARVLHTLEQRLHSAADMALLSDHLSLLRRWYYRPEKQRTGEIFFPNSDGSWPLRRILRGAARMVLGEPAAMAETQRDAAKTARVRILHEGRPDVEREVPVVQRTDSPSQNFTSRRSRTKPKPTNSTTDSH